MNIVIIILIILSIMYLFYNIIKENNKIVELKNKNYELRKQKQNKLDEISKNLNFIKEIKKNK